jgi:MFS superfamily sulfate permease-like transporter
MSNSKNRILNFNYLKNDIPASLVVFLVALPLCMGISVASGADPISGLIAGIVGGIVVTLFSGSALGVSGPAAGLVAIVIGAIHYFQGIAKTEWLQANPGLDISQGDIWIKETGFQMFLVAVVLSGLFQVVLGLAKLGKLIAFFPGAVIRGMLAAIGVIIILKQIPHAFGYDKDYEGDMAFDQADGGNTFTEIGNVFHSLFTSSEAIAYGPSIIFIIGILITLFWGLKFIKNSSWATIISAPLVIVVSGAIMVLAMEGGEFNVDQNHLVDLGGIEGIGDVFRYTPDFSVLTDPRVYVFAITLAIVGSLESLLCMEATDKMDPEVRHSPPNQELVAQGIGNLVSGFLGGIPVTQVIVRSSANLQAGAKSKLSSFLHGWWLLLSVLLIPGAMEHVPLSALAAILIIVGLKLARPSMFIDYYRRGWSQFVPFMVTLLAIIFTDLLIGIGVGFAVSLLITIYKNEVRSFKHIRQMIFAGTITEKDNQDGSKYSVITLTERISFLSRAKMRDFALKVKNDKVVLDLKGIIHVDGDGQEAISEIEERLQKMGKKVKKRGSALIK